ncbi:MAG: metalloregulator ArsR/SmtB family transcription factor [Desulfobacterales bacterium]|nr:metalloregulator ArsR/SmtB family transcription factor [Desulfobacterales bacterium]
MKESADLFKILSVDKRIEIIEQLKEEPMSVNALADALGITQSAVSQHLRVLKGVGLVKDERQGYWIYYSLNKDALEKCRQRLNRICTCGCSGGQISLVRINKSVSKTK